MTLYIGTNGNDTLTGLDDVDDELNGRLGDDVLIGGGGKAFDWASYIDASSAVTVNLVTGTSSGGDGNDTLDGIEGIIGSSHNDTLISGDYGSSLKGGLGNDILQGGKGFDWAYYDDASSSVIINLATGAASGGDGSDTLDEIEAVLGSVYNDNLTGNDNYNILDGGAGDDSLIGGNGGAELKGGLGNDILEGGLNSDLLEGGDGNDSLNAGDGYNQLRGGQGDDVLIGGGGKGFDWAYYDDAPSSVTVNLATGTASGGAGNDTLSGIEGIVGSNYNDTLTSGDYGSSLKGGLGNDVLQGGKGFDWAYYDDAPSSVTVNLATGTASGGAGNDTLSGIEGIVGSAFNDILTGDSNYNTLEGRDGNDTLNGGAGADTMSGGLGNDSYTVDNTSDVVTENSGEGTDKVNSKVTYTLTANVENLTLTGTSAINGTGNNLANTITGNTANNQLKGGSGNDTLDGKTGTNSLTGGGGKDTFKFTTAGHIDTITDFSVVDDTIKLENAVFTSLTTTGVLAVNQFRIGAQALDANDFIIYNNATGTLLYDADGSGVGAAVQIATIGVGLSMTNADIVVI